MGRALRPQVNRSYTRFARGRSSLVPSPNIHDVAKRYGRSPIVHIECHGDKHGVQLANGDSVAWTHIAPRLTVINRQSRMNLLVVAGMCHGWYMTDILRPVDRAPAFGIIGAMEEVYPRPLLAAMPKLYRVLTGPSHDLREALNAANALS